MSNKYKIHMTDLRTQMDNHGKILIPLQLRKKLNYNKGDTFVLRNINGELRVISLNKVISDIQEEFKTYTKSGESVVEDFLSYRRKQYKLEELKSKKYDN